MNRCGLPVLLLLPSITIHSTDGLRGFCIHQHMVHHDALCGGRICQRKRKRYMQCTDKRAFRNGCVVDVYGMSEGVSRKKRFPHKSPLVLRSLFECNFLSLEMPCYRNTTSLCWTHDACVVNTRPFVWILAASLCAEQMPRFGRLQ
ncbi:hypothetical protein ACQKWADRAFT_192231 [Trichoderma austrokoningii]